MKTSKLIILAIALLACTRGSAAPPDIYRPYRIIDLGTLGGLTSNAQSVNNHGQVVGENALIFGVVAGASYYQPTGLEFKAEVKYDLIGDCELDGDLDLGDVSEFLKVMTGRM